MGAGAVRRPSHVDDGRYPDFLLDEVLAFIRDAEPIVPGRFTGDYLHLFTFRSDDGAGEWWHGLRWTVMHAWRRRARLRLDMLVWTLRDTPDLPIARRSPVCGGPER